MSATRSLAVLGSALVLAIAGCGPSEVAPVDAGQDAPSDAGQDAGPPDGGPMCGACDPGAACCGTPEAPVCAQLGTDIQHCGECGVDCLADARGDRCEAGQCACGDFLLGCIGRFTSHCCIPADGVRDPYCANLAQDRTDCGACGHECSPAEASQCEGGRCLCGDTRAACAGTPESTCCSDAFENFTCVDTTTNRDHCGACGTRCTPGLRCIASACVP